MTTKLKNHPYAQAHVRTDENGTTLVSYETDVINVDSHGWLSCTGLYSMTTRKHIGYFLKEYLPHLTFHDIKVLVEHHFSLNVYTGEVINA